MHSKVKVTGAGEGEERGREREKEAEGMRAIVGLELRFPWTQGWGSRVSNADSLLESFKHKSWNLKHEKRKKETRKHKWSVI